MLECKCRRLLLFRIVHASFFFGSKLSPVRERGPTSQMPSTRLKARHPGEPSSQKYLARIAASETARRLQDAALTLCVRSAGAESRLLLLVPVHDPHLEKRYMVHFWFGCPSSRTARCIPDKGCRFCAHFSGSDISSRCIHKTPHAPADTGALVGVEIAGVNL